MAHPFSPPKHEQSTFQPILPLTEKKIRRQLNRRFWDAYNLYANFFRGEKFIPRADEINASQARSATKTSSFYADFLRFRAQQRESNKFKH